MYVDNDGTMHINVNIRMHDIFNSMNLPCEYVLSNTKRKTSKCFMEMV
jgi:hypothetical protein